MKENGKIAIRFAALALVFAVCFILDLLLGSINIPPDKILASFELKHEADAISNIILNFRLPKAITAVICGSGLAVAGVLMQTLFHNPLAGPYVLGISSGASLGVAALVLTAGNLALPAFLVQSGLGTVLAAIIGALAVMAIVLASSSRVKDSVTLLVVGMMFGSLAGSAVNVLQSVSNPDSLKVFVVWTMGSLSSVDWELMCIMAPLAIIGIIMSLMLQKPLNALLLGENHATGLGISIKHARLWIIIATCMLAGTCTAFTGPISFIGVAVPHIARGFFQSSDHKVILPASILSGAALLLVCDIISQLPGTGYTLPINSVSALVGVPIILWVIFKNKSLAS